MYRCGSGLIREKRAKRDILEANIVDISNIRLGRSLNSLSADSCKEEMRNKVRSLNSHVSTPFRFSL